MPFSELSDILDNYITKMPFHYGTAFYVTPILSAKISSHHHEA
jgi:hypothetical protein